eukprot:g8307.t1
MKYDTVIIGAGLSGLAAGIRLAHFEKSVCLLERHYTIGGLNSFYRLRKRDHDVGLHAVTNYAEPGTRTGPLSKLLRQLRLSWDDFALVPQNGSSVVFPGHTLRFTNEFAFFESQVAEQFPDQIDGFRRLLDRIDEHDELAFDRREVSGRAVVSECITNPTLVDMLFCPLMFYGSPTPADMDFNQFVIMFKSIFREGFGRPYGGVRPMLKALVKKFRSLGGELRLRSGVKRLHNDGTRVTQVELDDGDLLEADHVLSSAGSAETAKLCTTENQSPRQQIEPGAISFVETIFDLDIQPAELDHHDTIVFYNDSAEFRYEPPEDPIDLRSGIICSPNNFQYDEPLQEGRIRITALADPQYWMTLEDDEYVERKEYWKDRIVEAALRVMPDFRPHVVDTDVFTPRTIRKFTGHINGAVYGAPQKVVDGRTDLDNLFSPDLKIQPYALYLTTSRVE